MIVKAENKSNFTILSNAVLLDETISDKARGVLVRLLCRPENWNLNIKHLVRTGKTGNAAIRSAVKELEEAGYIRKEVTRDKNGRIIGIEYTVCESKGQTSREEVSLKSEQVHEETTHLDPDPEPGGQEAQPQEVQVQEPHIKDTGITENRMTETVIKETAPIINTDIKQILKVTTTTRAREAKQVINEQLLPMSSSSTTNEIINLIPEQHQTPVVLSLVNKAVMDYPEHEVKEAVAYAGANVRGGSMQFKAYLDKTLKNKWGEGFLDAMDNNSNPFGQNLFGSGQFSSASVTGSQRMDRNLAACLEFAALSKRGRATA
ncbi:hypothetical protein [Desulfobacter latus]|uniref:Helix-turn-helix domain-containing protein n=1 Tax=Desulfobacter latus TaxID=2292 RepID=A0A850T6Y1_9BACT|nr:hypothetical protein [Desulfobacter latus]NWH06851.1 hypothetical protein [Desulfobacter latus]